MCGLLGVIKDSCATELIELLSLLQYRGYDSYGIAVATESGDLETFKELGSVSGQAPDYKGSMGIGHTRWATHGAVSLKNTHPFCLKNFAVAQNGIITNYASIKQKFPSFEFQSDTDTECILPLLMNSQSLEIGLLREMLRALEGSYAILILNSEARQIGFMVRGVNPLLIGIKDDIKLLGSDIKLFREFDEVIDVMDGQCGILSESGLVIHPAETHRIQVTFKEKRPEKSCDTWFETEFLRQPEILRTALARPQMFPDHQPTDVYLTGCGSAYLVACMGEYWLREMADIKSHAFIPSHLPSTQPYLIGISQSGETADLLKVLKSSTAHKIAILNNVHSSASKYVDHVVPIYAHEEISVASTKATTCQMLALVRYAAHLGKSDLDSELLHVFDLMQEFIDTQLELISQVAAICHKKQSLLIIAKDILFPIACECALKIKELAYIHAEAIPSPELKHGPLALIDEDTVVFCFMLEHENIVSEILSRRGKVFVFTHKGDDFPGATVLPMPEVNPMLAPFTYILPAQWLAYSLAKFRGNSIDMPRNLAKSVTVE